jgi:glucose-1-phosphate cytidylyltransferase
MKCVILAGGLGTRISEETMLRPKPMVEIGGKPILWHIMKIYAAHGITDFIVCCGYKGYMIKEYFANYYLHQCDVTFDLACQHHEIHRNESEPWRVTLVDTGDDTMTGGRLLRVAPYLANEEEFCFTYGDGLGRVDITELISFHRERNAHITMTVVQPPGRFGAVDVDGQRVMGFTEKPGGDGGWINGGYFVLSQAALEYLTDDTTVWEREPLERSAREGQLSAYLHRDFWQPMDTLRDRHMLEQLWESGHAPWKIW